jgi:hypothetical protein
MKVEKLKLKMRKKNFLYYFAGISVAVLVEFFAYCLSEKLQLLRLAHDGSLDWLPLVYIFILAVSVILLMVRFPKTKFNSKNISLSLIVLALFHTTYQMWAIKCSCGEP